jgi:acetolactate synthase-1/2/3 large subunit
VVSEADLVLFVGSHTGDAVTNDFKLPKPGTTVIQIDIDASELGRNYPNAVSPMGDARAALSSLCQSVTVKNKDTQWAEHAGQIV